MIMPTRATLRPRAWSAPFSASPSGEKQSTSSRHNVYLSRYPIPSLPLTRLVSPKPRHFFLRHGCSLRLPLLGSGRAGASGEGIPEGSGGQDLAPFVMSPACDALCRRIPILPGRSRETPYKCWRGLLPLTTAAAPQPPPDLALWILAAL
jgi:hypothetical protein